MAATRASSVGAPPPASGEGILFPVSHTPFRIDRREPAASLSFAMPLDAGVVDERFDLGEDPGWPSSIGRPECSDAEAVSCAPRSRSAGPEMPTWIQCRQKMPARRKGNISETRGS
jgi:hypothetical protein